MPVLFQKFIFRSDLKSNPDVLYLFGDNLQKRGLGGQAKEMRGEPNANGIPTKVKPSRAADAYFSDKQFEDNCKAIEMALRPVIAHLKHNGIVIIPRDGLGTGLSELPQRAPKTNAFLENALDALTNISTS